jgi:diguanylate cyclase (GGDEF)-like protein
MNQNASALIEELYISMQVVILLLLLNAAFPIFSKSNDFHLKYFSALYLVYVLINLFNFAKKTSQRISDNIKPSISTGFIDGVFVCIFIYIYQNAPLDLSNLLFVYVLVQSIRFSLPKNLIFTLIASIIEVFISFNQLSSDLIFIDLFGNILVIILISFIVGFALNQITHLQNQKNYYYNQLTKKNNELKHLANTDFLTKLNNHQSFYYHFDLLKENAYKSKSALGLAIIDIDDFKKINDSFGHLAGDAILRELASLLSKNIRNYDFIARYGGEEFAILFPYADLYDCISVCERIRKIVEYHNFGIDDYSIKITISTGIQILSPEKHDDNCYDFIKEVDALLYQAKKLGKNKVIHSIM